MSIKPVDFETLWKIRKEVMWPDRDISFVQLSGDEKAKHLGFYLQDRCISVISIFETAEGLQLRKFATLLSEQGKGYGTQLLSHVIDKHVGHTIWCHARIEKQAFYEKFGFMCCSKPFEKSGKAYVRMVLEA